MCAFRRLCASAAVTAAFFCSVEAGAQPRRQTFRASERIFETVGDQQSLPGLIIAALAQDRTGFVWIGTHEGLVRHDGYRFEIFHHDPNDETSLADNNVRALETGDDGTVWVASSTAGVSVYSPATDRFRRITAGDAANTLWRNEARAFARGTGGMWIGTKRGLQFVTYGSLNVRRHDLPQDPSNSVTDVTALVRDEQGNLWIGTDDGLFVLRVDGRVERAGGAVDTWSRGKPLNRLFVGRNGMLWIGVFGGGLALYEPTAGSLTLPDGDGEPTRVAAFSEPTPGAVWIATQRRGIEVRDGATAALRERMTHDPSIPESIDSDRVASMITDRCSGIEGGW